MRSKVLIAAICWLALSEGLRVEKKVNSLVVKDNESAESAPRLYARAGNVLRVYASASPHGAYTFNAPTVIKAPLTTGSQVTPISVSTSVSGGTNGFLRSLRDSYGKYLASPQAVTYKAAFPQQFLPIQALPAHLSQPLAAAATPNLQYRPFAPNYFFSSPYKVPPMFSYSPTPTPLTQLGSMSKPLVYAGNIKDLLPISTFFNGGQVYPSFVPVQQQQATGSKSFYTNAPGVQQKQQQQSVPSGNGGPQKLDEHKGQIQGAPAQTSVTTIVNGKKTVVTLDTKPPIPQLDISLLEPLTFDNPVVPQVQHFLPKINTATYEKLPSYNIQHSNKKHKDIPVHRINVYNGEEVQIQPKKTSNKKKSGKQNRPEEPQVVLKGNPDGQGFSYEINMPNHKETYNEQVVSYDKQTSKKPVTYTYNKQSNIEPENYSFSHSSKEPLKVTHVNYVGNENPKHFVYNLPPEEDEEENNTEIHQHQPESEVSSTKSNDDEDSHVQHGHGHIEDNDKYSQRHKDYNGDHETPKQFIQNVSPVSPSYPSMYQNLPQFLSTYHMPSYGYYTDHQQTSTPHHHKKHHIHHSHLPAHYKHHHHPSTERTSNPTQNTEPLRQQDHSLKAEHRGQEYKQQPKQELQHEVRHNIKASPYYYSQPITVAVQNSVKAITPEYEEDIRILPTHAPQAQQRTQNHPPPSFYPKPFSSAAPNVLEQSKRVIIEEKEETPDVKHTHMEQVMAEMAEEAENEEEDFEKAYKASAFGFPGYESATDETTESESDLNNPDSYGAPRYQTGDYNVDNIFEKYLTDDDPFPKSLRSSYKDAREDKKENYYLDFSVNKPNAYADFYKNKADYYKSFKKHKPLIQKMDEDDRKTIGSKDERKVVAASSFHYPVAPTQKLYNSEYKAPNTVFNFDFSKGSPRDSRSYASHPYSNKYRTNIVEPQYQYGFEPITAPLVLDSELAAMASNDSPESEKPGMRKKVYEENWYIKKTRTAAGKPS